MNPIITCIAIGIAIVLAAQAAPALDIVTPAMAGVTPE